MRRRHSNHRMEPPHTLNFRRQSLQPRLVRRVGSPGSRLPCALVAAGFPDLDSQNPVALLGYNLLERAGEHYVDVGGSSGDGRTRLLAEGKLALIKADTQRQDCAFQTEAASTKMPYCAPDSQKTVTATLVTRSTY